MMHLTCNILRAGRRMGPLRSALAAGILFGGMAAANAQSPAPVGGTGSSPQTIVQALEATINILGGPPPTFNPSNPADSNQGGASNFTAGQFGFTPQFTQPPVVLPANPGMAFSPPPVFTQPPVALPSNPGLAFDPPPGLFNSSNPAGEMINNLNDGSALNFAAGQFGFTGPVLQPPVVLPVNPGLTYTPPPITTGGTTLPPSPPASALTPVVVTPSPLLSGTGYTFLNWGSDSIANLGAGPAVFDTQSALTKFTGNTSPFDVNSAVTVANAGHLDDLGWGRWVAGTVTDHGLQIDLSTLPSGMPYIVGRLTPDAGLPVSGKMTYALAGATPAIDRGTGAVGQLSGSLSITFVSGGYSVTPNLNISMNAGATYVTGSGTTTVGPDGSRAAFNTMTQNVTGGACSGGNCSLTTQGILTGAAANNAGIVYSLTAPSVQVTGAAGFKR